MSLLRMAVSSEYWLNNARLNVSESGLQDQWPDIEFLRDSRLQGMEEMKIRQEKRRITINTIIIIYLCVV